MSDRREDQSKAGDQTRHTNNKQRSIAEWTTLTISVAILVGILGLVSWLHFSDSDRPAVITVEAQIDQIRQEESGYYLPVIVRNEGNITVEDVQVQAELDSGSGEPETADFLITFLVGDEEVHGTFIFQNDPSQGELTTAAGSFKFP